MAYLGKGLGSLTTANITVDTMTGNGSATTMTITLAKGVNSVNDISAYVSGVMQRPGTDYTLSGSTLTFTTAPANGLKVVAISHGDSYLDNVADATVITESFADGAVTDVKVGSLSASKLTGALPAGSAANLTNLNAAQLTGALPAMATGNLTGITSYTKSASDPVVTTNPSGGVGTLWVNSSSGEVYSCTDATAGENVWTNVGGGSGDIQPYHGWGSNYAFSSNGSGATQGWGNTNTIDKFAFNSSANATDVGDSQLARRNSGGAFSTTHGYNAGGGGSASVIDKYAFASNGNATVVGNLTSGSQAETGTGCSSETYGYAAGGDPTASSNKIHKYAFASDANATNVGLLTTIGRTDRPAMTQSTTYGYCQGGGSSYVIDKWSFASDGNATNVGVLNSGFGSTTTCAGVSSSTVGHTCGGGAMASRSSKIEKHSFASDGDATNVGSLTLQEGKNGGYGTSSQTHGHVAGGSQANGTSASGDSVNKFSFSSDAIAVDTTQNLTLGRGLGGAAQY